MVSTEAIVTRKYRFILFYCQLFFYLARLEFYGQAQP